MLANEWTLLAYVRGARALLLAGTTSVYLSQALWFSVVVGGVCVVTGIVTLIVASRRFRAVQRMRRGVAVASDNSAARESVGLSGKLRQPVRKSFR